MITKFSLVHIKEVNHVCTSYIKISFYGSLVRRCILLKSLAMLVILVMFVPIATYGQSQTSEIIIEHLLDPNAPNAVKVTILGEPQEEGLVTLLVEGNFGPDSVKSYTQEHTFTKDNPKHLFHLSYSFLPNEVYTITATNGFNFDVIELLPLPSTQQESTSNQGSTSKQGSTSNQGSISTNYGGGGSGNSTSDDEDSVQSLSEENKLLRQEIEKKDAVLMEQVKVILDLASQITNAVFSNTIESMPHLIALEEPTSEQTTFADSVQSLQEENKLLREEIEKKDAVLMEQLRVIQDLASQLTNAVFEPTLNYFSLV